MSSNNLSLGDLLEVTSSKRIHMADYVDAGVPFYRGKEVIERAKGNKVSTELFIHPTQFENIKSKFGAPKPGDILLTSVGTLGVPLYISEHVDFYFKDGNLTWLRNFKQGVNPKFIYYWLTSPKTQQKLDEISIGSTQRALTIIALKSLKIELPTERAQAAIVEALDALTNRITLLRETNKTLEAIAQAIFKSWFVDFDPVRAKMEGRQPEGLDEATAALFPDSFEESELGLVPKGWRVQQLDQIAEYLNGLALQKYPPTGINDLPVIKIAQLRKGDTLGSDKASREIKPEYIIQDGDVLFSWSGSLEVEIWCGGEGALNQHLFKVTSRTFPKWLYLYATKLFLGEFRRIAESKATTMGHIQRRHLSDAKLALPDNVLISKLSEVFEPLLDRYISNSLQARTLVSIRDTLLPRLISGQLRLPEAQEQIENALP